MEKYGVSDICPVCQSRKIRVEKEKVSNAFEHYEETRRICTCGYQDIIEHQDLGVPPVLSEIDVMKKDTA